MNVFILCTGRCGSVSVTHACQHITNFTAGHETRSGFVGPERMNYPDNHIEADNRLSWYLGRLDRQFGQDAKYVHLYRDADAVARSLANRQSFGIMKAFSDGILNQSSLNEDAGDPLLLAADIGLTVTENIKHFLKDKPHRMEMRLEHIGDDFRKFWDWIGAEGDLEKAIEMLTVPQNTSADLKRQKNKLFPLSTLVQRVGAKVGRALVGIPSYLKNV